MKKEVVLLAMGASLITIWSSTLATEISYAAEGKKVVMESTNDEFEGNRVGFYENRQKKQKHPLLNQKMDLSSGMKIQKKYPVSLNDDHDTNAYLGSLYYALSGNLLFGRKA